MMKYLVTGGSGRLGREFKKHFKALYPTHQEFDITDFQPIKCGGVIHMAGYTDVDRAETEPAECLKVNVFGTYNLLTNFADKPFVFISSEHVYASGVYFQSKLAGELLVKSMAKKFLIIRTLFKTRPWGYDYAFQDQMTQGDYVDVIAPLIANAIKQWDGRSAIIYIGTGRKSIFDLAKQTKPDVKPNSVNDLPLKRPSDYRRTDY